MSTLKNRPAALTVIAAAILLGACSKPVEQKENIRPVRAIVLGASNVGVDAEFSGEVRARVESRLAFRVPGKVIARKVDPGTVVRRGQVLMQLDPQDLRLTQAQAQASLRAVETNRDLAQAELKRYQELRSQNFVSQTVLDQRTAAARAAQANVDAARAALAGQTNQAGYTNLVADVDGVVTAVDADVGTVVTPGMPVVRLAKSGDKEIVIGLPEHKVDELSKLKDVRVRLWANPNASFAGKVREVSPVADPATRTYAVRVSIPDSAPEVKLGMTALVQFSSTIPVPLIKVPLTALHHDKSTTSVWVVQKDNTVKLTPVQVGGTAGNEVVLAGGVQAGQTVVTAGVNVLKPGQKVKILPPEPAPGDSTAVAATGTTGAAK